MHKQTTSFDDEHLSIITQFENLGHLNLSMTTAVDQECAKLLNHLVEHFIHEEHFMLESSYTDFISHRNEHNLFYDHVLRFCENIHEITPLTFNTQLRKIILGFKHHVNNSDKLLYNAKFSEELKK